MVARTHAVHACDAFVFPLTSMLHQCNAFTSRSPSLAAITPGRRASNKRPMQDSSRWAVGTALGSNVTFLNTRRNAAPRPLQRCTPPRPTISSLRHACCGAPRRPKSSSRPKRKRERNNGETRRFVKRLLMTSSAARRTLLPPPSPFPTLGRRRA